MSCTHQDDHAGPGRGGALYSPGRSCRPRGRCTHQDDHAGPGGAEVAEDELVVVDGSVDGTRRRGADEVALVDGVVHLAALKPSNSRLHRLRYSTLHNYCTRDWVTALLTRSDTTEGM